MSGRFAGASGGDDGFHRAPQPGFAEARAKSFLTRLQDAVDDEVQTEVVSAFQSAFRECQDGVLDYKTAKHLVANLLADVAPDMLQDFLEMFDICCDTAEWAGKAVESHVRPSSTSNALPADGLSRASSDRRSTASRQVKRDWKAISAHLVPEGRGQFIIWFMIINTSVIIGMFAFMMGDYPEWVRENKRMFFDLGYGTADYQNAINSAGLKGFRGWLTWRASWRDFAFPYLLKWGGRFLPSIKDGEWWRWFTSIYIHQSLQHITANMLLFVSLVSHLELNYGFWRLTLVWIISGLGGNIVSAAAENPCTLVVGASGAVFGLMGLFIADVMLNFESISRPFVRIVIIVCFSIFFAVTVFTDKSRTNVSHYSHIGGLICGLFPSFLFLPNVMDKRWKAVQTAIQDNNRARAYSAEGAESRQRRVERMQRHQEQAQAQLKPSWWSTHFPFNPLLLLSAVVMVVVFICLPIYVYNRPISELDCNSAANSTTTITNGTGSTGNTTRLLMVKYG